MPGIFVQLFPFGAFDAEVGKSHHMARRPRVGAPGYTLKPRMATGGPPGTQFPLMWYNVNHTNMCLPQSLLFTYLLSGTQQGTTENEL